MIPTVSVSSRHNDMSLSVLNAKLFGREAVSFFIISEKSPRKLMQAFVHTYTHAYACAR